MIRDFLRRRRDKKALLEWQNSEIGKFLAAHTKQYFTEYPRLADMSEQSKSKIISDFYSKIFSICQSENPFMAMRELLATYVCSLCSLQIVSLTEEEKADSFYSNCPYISGSLYQYIDKAADHIEELRELKWKRPDIDKDTLISFCNSRCALFLYYLNGVNYLRCEFDDYDREKDWLQPFLKSMLIWDENNMREKLGLETLLPNSLDALKYSTFLNLVVNGHRSPFYEWEKNWGPIN